MLVDRYGPIAVVGVIREAFQQHPEQPLLSGLMDFL
jgi:hypothetical protein